MNKLSQVLYFDMWYYMQLESLTTVYHFQCLINLMIFKDLIITCVQKLWESLFTVSNTPSVLHFSQTEDFLNESAAGCVDPALLCFSLQLVPVATADMASCTLPRRWSQSATEAERQTVSWLERERVCLWKDMAESCKGADWERERMNEGLCKDVLCSLRPKSRNGLELKERNWEGDFERVWKMSMSEFTMHTMTVFLAII